MKSISAFFVFMLLIGCSQADAASESYSYNCSYTNLSSNQSYEGQCLETWRDDGRHEIVGGDFTFQFPAKERRQGQWTFTEMNGKPAVRFEIHRGKYSYATSDLQEFLDIE